MRGARRAATVATFAALIVGSNFVLYELPNVMLDAAVVVLTTIAFGVAVGASVAVISELVWSQVSPWGASGAYLLPFLLTAELLYVLAGWAVRRLLKGEPDVAHRGILFGGVLGIFTFLWDLWTNFGTALLATNVSLPAVLAVEFNPLTLPFSAMHELSNLLLGLALVPAVLLFLPKAVE